MSAEGTESVAPEDVRTRQIARQADATENLVDAVQEQNALLRRLVDAVTHGGR